MMLGHLIEKLDYVREVHIPECRQLVKILIMINYVISPINDDISICLYEAQSYEEIKLW